MAEIRYKLRAVIIVFRVGYFSYYDYGMKGEVMVELNMYGNLTAWMQWPQCIFEGMIVDIKNMSRLRNRTFFFILPIFFISIQYFYLIT